MLAMSNAFAPVILATPLIPVVKVANERDVNLLQLASSEAVSESPSNKHTSPTSCGIPITYRIFIRLVLMSPSGELTLENQFVFQKPGVPQGHAASPPESRHEGSVKSLLNQNPMAEEIAALN